MFQNGALFDSMTVYENVALPLRYTTRLDKKGPVWQHACRLLLLLEVIEPVVLVALVSVAEHTRPCWQYTTELH